MVIIYMFFGRKDKKKKVTTEDSSSPEEVNLDELSKLRETRRKAKLQKDI